MTARTVTVREADLQALLDRVDELERDLARARSAPRPMFRAVNFSQEAADRIAELEHALGITARVPASFRRLIGQHHGPCVKILGMLIARARITQEAAYIGLFSDRPDVEQPEPKCIDVYICALRKALRRHDIAIETIGGGLGWRLPPEMRARAEQLLLTAADHEPAPLLRAGGGVTEWPTTAAQKAARRG